MKRPETYRSFPKVCKSKHGQANSKVYRYVKLWQPPKPSHGDWPANGYCCLGRLRYAGPMRSVHYMKYGKIHQIRGPYLVAWWHTEKSKWCE